MRRVVFLVLFPNKSGFQEYVIARKKFNFSLTVISLAQIFLVCDSITSTIYIIIHPLLRYKIMWQPIYSSDYGFSRYLKKIL